MMELELSYVISTLLQFVYPDGFRLYFLGDPSSTIPYHGSIHPPQRQIFCCVLYKADILKGIAAVSDRHSPLGGAF